MRDPVDSVALHIWIRVLVRVFECGMRFIKRPTNLRDTVDNHAADLQVPLIPLMHHDHENRLHPIWIRYTSFACADPLDE